MPIENVPGAVWGNIKDTIQYVRGTKGGRLFTQGMAEGLGFEFSSGQYQGWLGRNMPGGILGEGGRWAKAGRAVTLPIRFQGFFTTAYSGFQGLREGGIWGGVKGVASGMVQEGLSRLAMSSPAGLAVLGGLAGGLAYRALNERGYQHRRKLRKLEMGSDIIDPFGEAATMRSRSLAAIQKSYINGRIGIGNEAAILHRQYVV